MSLPTIIDTPSPSKNNRPAGAKPELVVIHGTAGHDAGDLSYLRAGGEPGRQVSYHYLVLRDGTIHRLVNVDKRAWHCGKSIWRDRPDVNDFSIGIGLSNDGKGEQYTTAQYRSAGYLCAIFRHHFGIGPDKVVGHYHISGSHLRVRDDPKTDPWNWFEWGRLFQFMDQFYAEILMGSKQAA